MRSQVQAQQLAEAHVQLLAAMKEAYELNATKSELVTAKKQAAESLKTAEEERVAYKKVSEAPPRLALFSISDCASEVKPMTRPSSRMHPGKSTQAVVFHLRHIQDTQRQAAIRASLLTPPPPQCYIMTIRGQPLKS